MSIPKYIIYGPEKKLILSFSVDYHYQLIPKDGSKELVSGGGRVYVNDNLRVVVLYWESSDFGPSKREEVITAVIQYQFPQKWEGYTVLYAPVEAGHYAFEAWLLAEKILTITELISPNIPENLG